MEAPDELLARASHADTKPTELRALWADNLLRDDIARAVARHPSCPKNLYTHFLRYLPQELAENRSFQLEHGLKVLESMQGLKAQDPSPDDIKSDFFNRRSHAYQYHYHMRDERLPHRCTAAQFAPTEFVEAGLHDPETAVRVAMARRREMPEAWWLQLAGDTDREVRMVVARSKYAPKTVVQGLRGDADSKVSAAAIRNSPAEAVLAGAVTEQHDPSVRQAHARSTDNVELLATLATDRIADVRRAVAGNTATPADCLQALLGDGDASVRAALASRTNIDTALAEQLLKDSSASVREALAKNSHCPHAVQLSLTQNTESKVLAQLMKNSTHADVIDAVLAQVRNKKGAHDILLAAAGNALLQHSRDFGELLLAHPDSSVRALVTGVPNLVALEDLLQVCREHPFSRFITMVRVSPDRLLPLVELMVEEDCATDAFTILRHGLFSEPPVYPSATALRRPVLERLIKAFPKHSKASEARKLLKALPAEAP